MVGEGVKTDLQPGFSVERRNIVERQRISLRLFTAIYVEQQNRASVAPGCGVLLAGGQTTDLVIGIGRKLYGFWREQPGGLMMAVAGLNTAPAVDDNRWPERADDLDHVLQDFVAPDFFCFLGSIGIAEVFGASEIEFDAVTACGRQQLLRANETKLGGLLGAEIVLPAFTACQRKERDFGMEAAGEISEYSKGFVVGMGRDVKDARGYACVFDGFHGFRKSRTGAGGRGELGFGAEGKNQ